MKLLFRERPGESVCVTLSAVQDASGSNFEHVFILLVLTRPCAPLRKFPRRLQFLA